MNLVAAMMKKVLDKGVDESVSPDRGIFCNSFYYI